MQIAFFAGLSHSLIKELLLLKLITESGKKALDSVFPLYFLFVFFYFKDAPFYFLFLIIPCFLLLFLLYFLKREEEKELLSQLYSLLMPLESQMKLGSSFVNAWQKTLKSLKSEKTRDIAGKITDVLKFQNEFCHSDKEVENFTKDLIIVHQSPQPLRRLKHLQRKIKVEQSFQIKSKRALLQIRVQSGLLSLFYFGLLVWTVTAYGSQYIHLILLSFLFFCVGLIWILKAGRRMKWSV